MLKAVLFDLDGTVTDTERVYQKYWLKSAQELGFSDFTAQDALDLRSLNHKDAEILMHDRFGTDFDIKEIRRRTIESTMNELKQDGIKVKPGLDTILSFLKENNIKSAIVTATDKEKAEEKMVLAGINGKFDTMISAHEVKHGKPHPDSYLYALDTLNIDGNSAIAVEDSPNGILSAYRAGIPVVMIPDMTKPDFRYISYLYGTVPTLADLVPLLKDLI